MRNVSCTLGGFDVIPEGGTASYEIMEGDMNLKKSVLAGVVVLVLTCIVFACSYQDRNTDRLADQAAAYGMSGFASPDGILHVIVWNTTTGESAHYISAPGNTPAERAFRKTSIQLPAKPLKE